MIKFYIPHSENLYTFRWDVKNQIKQTNNKHFKIQNTTLK